MNKIVAVALPCLLPSGTDNRNRKGDAKWADHSRTYLKIEDEESRQADKNGTFQIGFAPLFTATSLVGATLREGF